MGAHVASRPQVDARVLASGTGLRFVVLLALLLVSTASVSSVFLEDVGVSQGDHGVGCALAAGVDPFSANDWANLVSLADQREAYDACNARFTSRPPWWLVPAWMALLVVAATALFWGLPAWKGRRGRVVPLEAIDGHDELVSILASLVGIAGLARSPRFVVDPAAATMSAVVYGRFRRHIVCLHGGLLARRHADPDGFRAVVLHELAHIRNGDVGITYATNALWRVFALGVFTPYLVWQVAWIFTTPSEYWPGGLSIAIRNLAMTATMVVLVYLARADVLRSREIYADLDAVQWGARTHRWHLRLPPGVARQKLASFAELWRTHPRWDLRRESLTDPAALFALQALPMFLIGAVAALVLYQATVIPALASVRALVVWLTAAMVAGFVGISAWRAVTYAVLTSRVVPSGLRAGLWLGTGFVVGEFVTNKTSLSELLPAQPAVLLLPVLAGAVITWWITECAHLWVTAWRGRTLRPIMLLAVVTVWLAFGSAMMWWDSWSLFYAHGWPFSTSEIRQLLDANFPGPDGGHSQTVAAIAVLRWAVLSLISPSFGLTGWAATALWVFPVLAYTTRAATTKPNWIDRAQAGASTPQRDRLPPLRLVLLTGATGGLACWAAVVAVMAYLHPGQPRADQSLERYELIYQAWTLTALVATTTATAAVMSIRAQRFRLPATFIAAHLAALIGVAGTFIFVATDGCLGPLNTVAHTCQWSPKAGWLTVETHLPLVLVLTTITSAVVALVTAAIRKQPRDKPIKTESIPRKSRTVVVTALVAFALALTTVVEAPRAVRPSADSSPDGLGPFRTVTTTPSPDIRGLQVFSWELYGGGKLIDGLVDAFDRLQIAVVDASQGPHAGTIEQSVFDPICADFQQRVQQAEAYFRIPDPRAQALWEQIVTQTKTGSRHCQQSFDSGGNTLFLRALDEIIDAVSQVKPLRDRLEAIYAAGLPDK
jgi:Zn-dependent protease with chaperone function